MAKRKYLLGMSTEDKVQEAIKWHHSLAYDEMKDIRNDAAIMRKIADKNPKAIMYAEGECLLDEILIEKTNEAWILEQIKNPTELVQDRILELKIIE